MTYAIHELHSIASISEPRTRLLIEEWIKNNVQVVSIAAINSYPGDAGHKEWTIQRAKMDLAVGVIQLQNSYPHFQDSEFGPRLHLSAVVLK